MSQDHPRHHERHAGSHLERVRVVAAVVWDGDRVLLTQRPPGGPHGLMWEFPGGKIEAGESAEHALAREIREELGVTARPLELLSVETHHYPHGPEVELHFVRCELATRDFCPSPAVHAVRWERPADVDARAVLPGDRSFLASLAERWA